MKLFDEHGKQIFLYEYIQYTDTGMDFTAPLYSYEQIPQSKIEEVHAELDEMKKEYDRKINEAMNDAGMKPHGMFTQENFNKYCVLVQERNIERPPFRIDYVIEKLGLKPLDIFTSVHSPDRE